MNEREHSLRRLEERLQRSSSGRTRLGPRGSGVPALAHIAMISCLLPACSCGENSLVGLEAVLDAPSSVSFGSSPVGERATATISLSSMGTGSVRLSEAFIDGDSSGSFSLREIDLPKEIEPGREVFLDIFFEPPAAGPSAGMLMIRSPDTEVGLTIELAGEGVVPSLVLCAGDLCDDEQEGVSVDVGEVSFGESRAASFRIENRGEATLRVSAVRLEPEGLAAGFRVLVDLQRAAVAPGRHIEVPVALLGVEQGLVDARVYVTTNDPERIEAEVELIGVGLVAARPRACAAVLEVRHPDGSHEVPGDEQVSLARPGDLVLFTAHPRPDCSAADGGRQLTYRWALLERPAGSGARIMNASAGPAPGSPEHPPSLAIDAVGLYVVGLEVHDGARASEISELVVDARSEDDLTLELTWTVPADLDLHLVAPGGIPFCSPLDCFWDTCIGEAGEGIPLLDWGPDTTGDGRLEPDGDPGTNPVLVFDNEGDRLVDEETGLRMETIRLQVAPSVASGRYLAGVHYFADREVTAESFEVIVRLHRHGTKILETRRVFETGQVGWWWDAISIDAGSFEAVAGETFVSVPSYVQPLPCP